MVEPWKNRHRAMVEPWKDRFPVFSSQPPGLDDDARAAAFPGRCTCLVLRSGARLESRGSIFPDKASSKQRRATFWQIYWVYIQQNRERSKEQTKKHFCKQARHGKQSTPERSETSETSEDLLADRLGI